MGRCPACEAGSEPVEPCLPPQPRIRVNVGSKGRRPRRGARISPAFKAMRPESTSNHAVKRGVIRGKRKTPILQYSNTPLGRIRGRGRFCAGAWREQNQAAQLRRWIGAGAGRKIFYANLLVNALDPGRARCLADIADGEGCDSAAGLAKSDPRAP
jgi:hypothetical protein